VAKRFSVIARWVGAALMIAAPLVPQALDLRAEAGGVQPLAGQFPAGVATAVRGASEAAVQAPALEKSDYTRRGV
jgi:hypothetical protein